MTRCFLSFLCQHVLRICGAIVFLLFKCSVTCVSVSDFTLLTCEENRPYNFIDLFQQNDLKIMEKICVVHDRKYLSKFHGTINQLRQSNEFNGSILQQLPRRCCSCGERNGESLFTIDHLRELCHQIQLSENLPPVISPPIKPIHYLILEFSPMLTHVQRVYKAGRFIGRNGQHLRLLQRTLNVRINILNNKSTKDFRQIVNKLQTQNNETHINDLWILITLKNENDDLEKVKQSLENAWKQIDVTTKKRSRSVKIRSSVSIMPPSTSVSGDTRWKPKKQKAKDKYKSKLNQYDEQEEVPPQPIVPPISMPTQINKYQKNKRK